MRLSLPSGLLSPPKCLGLPESEHSPQPLPDPQSPLSSRLMSLTKKNSFWIHRVNCLGTEPHLANCQVQVAPAQGKLRPACPGGMHAVVNCVAGPRFRPPTSKPERKESPAEVGPPGACTQAWRHRPHSQALPCGGGTEGEGLPRTDCGEGPTTPMETRRKRANCRMEEPWDLFITYHKWKGDITGHK